MGDRVKLPRVSLWAVGLAVVGARLDAIGEFIVVLHQSLGHRKAETYLGEPPGDMNACILCQYNDGLVDQAAVIEQLGVEIS